MERQCRRMARKTSRWVVVVRLFYGQDLDAAFDYTLGQPLVTSAPVHAHSGESKPLAHFHPGEATPRGNGWRATLGKSAD